METFFDVASKEFAKHPVHLDADFKPSTMPVDINVIQDGKSSGKADFENGVLNWYITDITFQYDIDTRSCIDLAI